MTRQKMTKKTCGEIARQLKIKTTIVSNIISRLSLVPSGTRIDKWQIRSTYGIKEIRKIKEYNKRLEGLMIKNYKKND